MKLVNALKTTVAASLLSTTLFAGALGTHWGYTGHESPAHWAELNPLFFMCEEGSNQSPINIEEKSIVTTTKGLDKIEFNYPAKAISVINNGHTIQVNVEKGSFINIDGIKFNLLQFHFHTPSENQINGKHFPLEAHFVHASEKGKLAVVSIMFEEGAENKVIKKIWNKMPKKEGKATCRIPTNMAKELIPKNKEYYRFDGSLTTPPCSEGVRWFVLQEYTHISKAQVKEFAHIIHGHDNRPIQPINARKILK